MNRVSEAFIKTLKCDYARLSVLPDSETVITLFPIWLGDYKGPQQSRMKFLSPREFLSHRRLAQRAICPVERVQTESIRMN